MATRESGRGLQAENLELTARLRRSGPVLENMARELATARRKLAAVTRENATLRAQLAIVTPTGGGGEGATAAGEGERALRGSWCPTCGLAIDADTLRHETAILAADCCPRCDGRLLARERQPSPREPSVFLG
jgi:hypothetical protein